MKVILFNVFAFLLASMLSLESCNENAGAKQPSGKEIINKTESVHPFILSDEFKAYWYAGKAEISSYKLTQARYGEIHGGSAVLVFVTEDFSKSKQVKLDDPEKAGDDRLPVLKLNMVKKFVTGIYPYSLMMSAFSPVDIIDYPHAVKTTASVQEWCGMTFTQINNRNGKFSAELNSYFETEGDQKQTFEECWLEDELWARIRIDPEKLPMGSQKVLPGSLYTRLSHQPLKIQEAKLRLEKREGKSLYFIEYPSLKYLLLITFKNEFPYQIIGWEETFPGFDGKSLTTTAILDRTLVTDYWNHHNNSDRALREQLNLLKDF